MAKSSNVSRINEAYIEQHDAYIRRQKQRKKSDYFDDLLCSA